MRSTNKSRPIRIAPSILSADFSRLGQQIELVTEAGADLLHVDVMDGHFVPNLTIGPAVVAAAKKCSPVELDVHLMIANPSGYLEAFAAAGADRLTIHLEAETHIDQALRRVKDLGCLAGLAINPGTPFSLADEVLPLVDYVLVMSVNPGFGGQEFLPSAVQKILNAKARMRKMDLDIPIEVDGGIDPDNAGLIAGAGAEILVAGSAVYGADDPGAAIAAIREAASASVA